MDILLCHIGEAGAAAEHEFTSLFQLAATLEKAGYSPAVFHGKPWELEKRLGGMAPRLVGFSCDYDNYPLVARFSRNLAKSLDVPIVAGGPQSAHLGEAFLRSGGCRYVLRGEADHSIVRLADALLRGTGDTGSIPGLAYLDGEAFRENAPAEPVRDLDSLPRPAFHCSLHPRRRYGRVVFSGRGCPYRCAYCASGGGGRGRNAMRLRSIPSVLAEIRENLIRWPDLGYIIVMDDTFTVDRERVLEFCRGMKEIRREWDVVWYCECHIGGVRRWRDVIPAMIDAGLLRLQVGTESGDSRVLELYGKNVDVAGIEEFAAYACECGLPQLATNFIVGGPKEEKDATAGLIERLLNAAPGVIDIITGYLRAYPGTPIRRDPGAFGLELHDPDDVLTREDYPFVTPVGVTQREVMAERQRLNRLIRATMGKLIKERSLPDGVVMRQFDAAHKYGVRSRWFEEMAANQMAYDYYYARYIGENNGGGGDGETYPQRTFEFWRTVSAARGYPVLNGFVLAPIEYELLLQCSGKRSVGVILGDMHRRFGAPYPNRPEFDRTVRGLLADFEKRFWITNYSVNPGSA